jgi:hypothetical protein
LDVVNRSVVVILLALLLGVASFPVIAETGSTRPPDISLGFDQSSLVPVSQGLPVYTLGDQVWIESHYNYSVIARLSPPAGSSGSYNLLYYGEPVSLYTFQPGDPTGTWTLDLTYGSGFVASMSVTVVSLSENSSVLFRGASVSSGFLSTSYSLHADGAYDIQACVLGTRTSGLQLSIPPSYGTGTTLLNMTGSSYSLAVRGALLGPTEIWFELYHTYSFASVGNASGLTSRLVQVGTSSPLVLSQSTGTNISSGTISFNAGLRQGRYTLRSYFRSAQGIQVAETELLLKRDGSWLSLANCVASSQPSGLDFSLTTSLQAPVEAWPREAVVMFRVGGLEGYAEAPFDAGLSAVSLEGTPWNQTLSYLSGSASGVTVEGSETINGTVYVLSSVYPATAYITTSFGGNLSQKFLIQLGTSYSHQSLMIPSGKLVVQTTLNGAPSKGARVGVTAGGNTSISELEDSSGEAVFYLPQGNFTVSAGTGGSVSSRVQIVAGKETDVTLELAAQESGTFIWVLAGIGVVGLGANVFVWWKWWRNRKLG